MFSILCSITLLIPTFRINSAKEYRRYRLMQVFRARTGMEEKEKADAYTVTCADQVMVQARDIPALKHRHLQE